MSGTDTIVSREEILDQFRPILVELFELEEDSIVLDANLYEDLDIDSIDAVDLIVKLRDVTGKKLAPEAFKQVRTVGDVVEALYALINE